MKRKTAIMLVVIVTIGFVYVFQFNDEKSSAKEQGKIKIQVEETCAPEVDVKVYPENERDEAEEMDESSNDSVELHMDTYKELEKEHVWDKKEKTKQSSTQDTDKEKNDSNSDTTNSTKVVIDESEETMKDETKGAEKEYAAQREPQGKIELHEPEESEGKDITIDTKPGGKKNIGTWG